MKHPRLLPALRSAAAAILVAAAASPAPAAAPVCGDVNDSGTVTSSDALLVLKDAVGQPVVLQCAIVATPPVTGQVTCYDADGAEVECAGTGQDGELQQGLARTFTDHGDGTITDEATGLMWEQLTHDGSIHDMDNAYAWEDAWVSKIELLNSAMFAGHADWRLPNVAELQTLANFGSNDPAAWVPFHHDCAGGACDASQCSCTASVTHWSSTSYKGDAKYAWGVGFLDGFTIADDKHSANAVRAVRGGN
jgi:hypothetical protein